MPWAPHTCGWMVLLPAIERLLHILAHLWRIHEGQQIAAEIDRIVVPEGLERLIPQRNAPVGIPLANPCSEASCGGNRPNSQTQSACQSRKCRYARASHRTIFQPLYQSQQVYPHRYQYVL